MKKLTQLEIYRRKHGLSYSKLAEYFDVEGETVRRWCLDTADPRRPKREMIEELLKTSR